VPRDLSLVSFDDTPMVRLATPPLTAVDQPIAEVTARATRLIIDRVPATGEQPPIVVPAKLEIRQSTGPAPARRSSAEAAAL
jgi:LacI family transcriptional regulator